MPVTRKKRILIADDEEGIREALTLILEGEYSITYATNGQEALRMAQRRAFDVVLLDVKMPKLDGFDVLQRLRAGGNPTPVLILTAYQSIELAKEAVKLGASEYLPKPFDRFQVQRVVADALKEAEVLKASEK
jgi:two-component system NtrC family response regulator/two-component system nitrogen regulation response regulator GlnG